MAVNAGCIGGWNTELSWRVLEADTRACMRPTVPQTGITVHGGLYSFSL